MIKSTQGYFGNLFTKHGNENKETNIRFILMIQLDELFGWTNKQSQKSE